MAVCAVHNTSWVNRVNRWSRSRVNTALLPAEMGGDEQDVSPELNIVLAAAAELHLLPPDSEHLLLQEMGFF